MPDPYTPEQLEAVLREVGLNGVIAAEVAAGKRLHLTPVANGSIVRAISRLVLDARAEAAVTKLREAATRVVDGGLQRGLVLSSTVVNSDDFAALRAALQETKT